MKSTNINSATGRRPQRRRADGGADERRFRDRRIEHPAGKLVVEPLGDAEHAAPGVLFARRTHAAGVVLAHDDHGLVARHLLDQRFVIAC